MKDKIDLEILLPAHNEAESIENTVKEIYEIFSEKIDIFRFLICEDGSSDGTIEIIKKIKNSYPIKFITSKNRKRYSKAVYDGLNHANCNYLLFLDADGQCDPNDFWKFWELRSKYDLIVGYRKNRKDPFHRRLVSRFFYLFYKIRTKTELNDPSCPFLLMNKDTLEKMKIENYSMIDGFWWEFNALFSKHNLSRKELIINHRLREFGDVKTLKVSKLPKVGFHHLIKLFKLSL